jgi:hypothetical protein
MDIDANQSGSEHKRFKINRSTWLIFAISFFVGFLVATALLKSFPEIYLSNKETKDNKQNLNQEEIKEIKETSATTTIYPFYKLENINSPDNNWYVELKYLKDFRNNCDAKIQLYSSDKKAHTYRQDNGWRGNYFFTCEYVQSDQLLPEEMWEASFSGWAQNSNAFAVEYDKDNEGTTEHSLLFTYNEDGNWLVRKFPIKGTAIAYSPNLDHILTTNIIAKEQVEFVIYNDQGDSLVSKTNSYIYSHTPTHIKIPENNSILLLVPDKELGFTEAFDNQRASIYLANLVNPEIKLLGTAESSIPHGPPCKEISYEYNQPENTLKITGGCFTDEIIYPLNE